jgi:hypothetical protein
MKNTLVMVRKPGVFAAFDAGHHFAGDGGEAEEAARGEADLAVVAEADEVALGGQGSGHCRGSEQRGCETHGSPG